MDISLEIIDNYFLVLLGTMKRESDFSGFHFSKSKSNVAFIV